MPISAGCPTIRCLGIVPLQVPFTCCRCLGPAESPVPQQAILGTKVLAAYQSGILRHTPLPK